MQVAEVVISALLIGTNLFREIPVAGESIYRALVARLGMLPLADLVVEPPSLEEAFLERYR